ncbi:MAG: DUF4911 domain-containing protein [Halothermotrichaceae bacterium]
MFSETDTTKIKVKVPPKEIVFIDMIIKAYEGLAVLSVDKKEKGLIYLDVTEGTKTDVIDIIEGLKKDIDINILK